MDSATGNLPLEVRWGNFNDMGIVGAKVLMNQRFRTSSRLHITTKNPVKN